MSSELQAVIYTVLAMTVIFCGVLVVIMRKYGAPTVKHDGFLNVVHTEENIVYQFEIPEDKQAEDFQDQERVIFKVRKIQPPS